MPERKTEGGDGQYGASLRCHYASRYNVFHVTDITLRIKSDPQQNVAPER